MKKPVCLSYGFTPRLIPLPVAASYCGMEAAEFEEFFTGQAIKSRSGQPLYDRILIDRWLDQRSGMSKATSDPRKLLERLGHAQAKGKTAHVV